MPHCVFSIRRFGGRLRKCVGIPKKSKKRKKKVLCFFVGFFCWLFLAFRKTRKIHLHEKYKNALYTKTHSGFLLRWIISNFGLIVSQVLVGLYFPKLFEHCWSMSVTLSKHFQDSSTTFPQHVQNNFGAGLEHFHNLLAQCVLVSCHFAPP